jgi:hypothetical protein
VRTVLATFVAASCAPTPEVEANRAQIESARQAWTKRLGMVEADWSDVVAYVAAPGDDSIKIKASTDALSAATPMDQFAIIQKAGELTSGEYAKIDRFYATDMFEASLSQLGRFAFLTTTCLDTDRTEVNSAGLLGTEVPWAVCQADVDRFDLAKFLAEVRAETAHDGAARMKLRVAAFDLPKRIATHAAAVQQMLKRDDANKKLFEVAANARSEWSSGIGKNTKLLDLVLAMESARLAQSRKQLDGCGDKTAAALAEAVSTMPANALAGLHDERGSPVTGFASKAGLVLVRSPAVNLAAIAYVQCTPESGTSEFLRDSLGNGPALRGPRSAALSAIKGTKLVYDKVGAELRYPSIQPYGGGYPDGKLATTSWGGPIAKVVRKGDMLAVDLEKNLVKQEQCLKSHSTGRVARVRDDGSVEYERVCDKSGVVVLDETGKGLPVAATHASWLKPGVVFSAHDTDVIAVWPSKTAKAPSMILGGAVK